MVINGDLPPGKRWHNYGKSPYFMGKSTMAMFNSYVKLPEATKENLLRYYYRQCHLISRPTNRHSEKSRSYMRWVSWARIHLDSKSEHYLWYVALQVVLQTFSSVTLFDSSRGENQIRRREDVRKTETTCVCHTNYGCMLRSFALPNSIQKEAGASAKVLCHTTRCISPGKP